MFSVKRSTLTGYVFPHCLVVHYIRRYNYSFEPTVTYLGVTPCTNLVRSNLQFVNRRVTAKADLMI